jgi:hypothetical protein
VIFIRIVPLRVRVESRGFGALTLSGLLGGVGGEAVQAMFGGRRGGVLVGLGHLGGRVVYRIGGLGGGPLLGLGSGSLLLGLRATICLGVLAVSLVFGFASGRADLFSGRPPLPRGFGLART